jgi:hypothetical protein
MLACTTTYIVDSNLLFINAVFSELVIVGGTTFIATIKTIMF